MNAAVRVCLALALGVLALTLHPATADSEERIDPRGKIKAEVVMCPGPLTTEAGLPKMVTDADGNAVQDIGPRATLAIELEVLFLGLPPDDPTANDPADASKRIMDLYRPVFRRVAEILYDVTEGDIWLRRVVFTNRPDRRSECSVVINTLVGRGGVTHAIARRDEWDVYGTDSNIQLTLEHHICDADNKDETFGKFPGTTGATYCGPNDRAPFGIVHELGHYLFGLQDEYSGIVWQNCNTNPDLRSQCDCELLKRCETLTGDERTRCEIEARTRVGVDGSQNLDLKGVATSTTGTPSAYAVDLVQAAGELTIQLNFDADQISRTRRSRTTSAADAIKLVIMRPDGELVVADPQGLTAVFRQTRHSALWTIKNAAAGRWLAVVTSTVPDDQALTFLHTVNYSSRYNCSNGADADAAGATLACVMDGGTTVFPNNLRSEYCTSHGTLKGTSHNSGDDEVLPDQTSICKVVRFTNNQEYHNASSCWEMIANSRIRKRFALALQGEAANRIGPPTEEELKNPPFPLLLSRRMKPITQALPQGMLPRFGPREEDTAAGQEQGCDPTAITPTRTGLTLPDGVNFVTGAPGFLFVLDASNSMGKPGFVGGVASDLDKALSATADAVRLITDEERFGVMTFSDSGAEAIIGRTFFDGTRMLGGSDTYDVLRGADARADFLLDMQPTFRADVVAAGDHTAMGDAIRLARAKLKDFKSDAMSTKAVILVTDGRSNEGQPVIAEARLLAALDRVQINTVAVGKTADVKTLERLARETGGRFFLAETAADLRLVLPRVLAATRDEDEVASFRGTLTGGAQADLDVGLHSFVDQATFIVSAENADNLTVTVEDLGAANDPSDNVTYTLADDGVNGLEFRRATNQIYFRLDEPPAGDWVVHVSNSGAAVEAYALQVFTKADSLLMNCHIRNRAGTVTFPAPVAVEASISAPWAMTGLDVRVQVTRAGDPDFEPVLLTMRDDGAANSGDRWAADGVYAALFYDYKARPTGRTVDDVYVFNIIARNDPNHPTEPAQGFLVPLDDGIPNQPFVAVPGKFTLQCETRAIVQGVPEVIPNGKPVLETIVRTNPVPATTYSRSDLDTTPVFWFRLTGRDEYMILQKLELELEVDAPTDPSKIDMVGLYLDSDGDYVPDNPLKPVSWGRFTQVPGEPWKIAFRGSLDRDLWVMPVGGEYRFLVTLGQPKTPGSTLGASPAPLLPQKVAAPQPAAPVGLLWALAALAAGLLLVTLRSGAPRFARHATTVCFVALLFVFVCTLGCGGGGGEASSTRPVVLEPTRLGWPPIVVPPAEITGRYRFTLRPEGIDIISAKPSGDSRRVLGESVVREIVVR